MLLETELEPQRLIDALKELISEGENLSQMGDRARVLAHRDAVKVIGAMVLELSGVERSG